MIKKICDLNLDMFSKYTTHTEYVLVQGDIGANEFVINLQYKKEPMNLSNTTTTITFRKSDGNKVKGTPDIINVTQGVLRYEVGEQEVACAGKVEATVEVYDSFGSRLTSGVFSFEVREQFDDGTAIESTTEYPFLAHLMSAGANELERKEAESLRVSSEQTRESNEASRNSAEATRVSQENTRVSQENTRKTSETARASAESTRVSQENTRKTQETSRVNAESARVTAETGRATAESTRATQESNRVTAESGRATAEATRVSQENTRKSNETARQSAETKRSTAETARQTAETTREDQEDARETNEATRVANEATRVSQESTRQTQETARVNAEGDSTKGRVKAENLRVTAESGRATAENTRVSQENTRKSQETARVNAESARASAESARVTAETGRSNAEAVRVTSEDARKTAETARASAESSRATAETARASAESTRVSQENTRKSNETARQSAETTRQTQETARQTNTTSAINRLDDAVESTVLIWKPAVSTYSNITTTYPSPQLGWRVETNDTKRVYRYDGSTWVHVSDGGLGYEAENTANKGVANGYAPLDANNKVPSTHLPPLNYIPTSQKGVVNGVASLGADGKVPSTQLPPLDYAGSTHTHTKSEITDFPTSMPANGGNSDTVDGKHASDFALASQVLTNVPAGAKFTDTVYTHPTSDGNKHVPATGTTNNGKVLKAGATAGSLSWANDNDTITTINGKTGAITKADIVALGIPAQDTVYSHPSSHPATMITEDSSHRFVTDSEKTIWNNKSEIPLVIGTQTATTPSWAGVCDTVESLYSGLTIRYWLPTKSSTNVTLNLTLRGGIKTGAIPCYYGGTTRLSTHYPAGSFIMMIYLENALINGNAYTGWWAKADYADGTESYTVRWNASVKAGAEITQYKLIMQSSDARYYPTTIGNTTAGTKTVSSTPFLIGSPILFYLNTSTIPAEGLTTSAYVYSGLTTSNTTYAWNQNSGWRANEDVYLKGTVSGALFRLDDTTPTSHMTQDLPTSDDGFYYMRLGMFTNTTTGFRLSLQHPIYYFANGELQSLNTSHGVEWEEVMNKPLYFQPAVHSHGMSDVQGLGDVATISKNSNTSQYLRGDGTWATPPNTTYGVATTSANGLMSSTDKSKLDGIASDANNYSHPASHPATMITEDASHRFVTDTEKSTWNNKANKASTLSGYGITDGVTYGEYLSLSNLVQENYSPIGHTHAYVPTTRTVNGKALSANISLTASDVGASASSHTHSTYVPTTRTVNGKALSGNISLTASDVGASASSHTHAYVPTSRTVNGKALSANISLTASDVGASASSHTHAYQQVARVANGLTGNITNSKWVSVSFGKTFPSAPSVVATGTNNVSGDSFPKVRNVTTTGFEIIVGGLGYANAFRWIAILAG